jgi:hypothetical protein
MNENVDYKAKSPSKSTKFLWWCAGADEKILMYCSYSDHVKYLGIGGVVLATAFMAALSMGFAMHTIFKGNWWVTLPISLIWALIVFNLDRFIVSSTGKGDGESTISWSELGNATPRLMMAILLGLTISAPLETTIFGSEIEREWTDTKKELTQKSLNESRARMQTSGQVAKAQAQFVLDSSRLAEKDKVLLERKKVIENILSGLNGFDKCTAGANCPRHKEYYSQRDQAEIERDSAQTMFMTSKNKLIESEEKDIKKLEEEAMKIDTMQSGFLDKIMMIEKLSSHKKEIPQYDPITFKPLEDKPKKEIYGSAFWAIWLVRLLFMIIEIAPVVLKLMLIKSPYDYMGENVNQILEAKQGISMNHVTDEEGKLTKYKENYNPRRIIAIVEHQNAKEEENAKEAITLFAEKEKKEIANNPDAFINPNDSSN